MSYIPTQESALRVIGAFRVCVQVWILKGGMILMFQKVKADLKQIKFRRYTCGLSNLAQANSNLFEASIGACLVEYLTYYYLN